MTGSGAASGNGPSSSGSAPWKPAHFSRWVLPAWVPLTACGLNHTPSSPQDPTQTHQPREGTASKPSSIHSTTLYCMLSSLHPENRQSDYPEVQSCPICKDITFPITLGSKAEAFLEVSGVGGVVVYHTDLAGQDCLSFRSPLPHVPCPPRHTHFPSNRPRTVKPQALSIRCTLCLKCSPHKYPHGSLPPSIQVLT